MFGQFWHILYLTLKNMVPKLSLQRHPFVDRTIVTPYVDKTNASKLNFCWASFETLLLLQNYDFCTMGNKIPGDWLLK